MLHQSNRRGATHIVLREETRNSLGYPLCYRFSLGGCEERPHFLISVASAEEQSEIAVGSDLLRALDYFHRIVSGSVTPCSLAEIGEDLAYSDIF
jgi:hypothetical protein